MLKMKYFCRGKSHYGKIISVKQNIDGAGFMNMKTLMDKMDWIESTLEKKLEKQLFSEHEFVRISVEDDINAEPTAVISESRTILFCHNKNTAFNNYFNTGGTACKVPKCHIFHYMDCIHW